MFGHQQQDDQAKVADFNPALPTEMTMANNDVTPVAASSTVIATPVAFTNPEVPEEAPAQEAPTAPTVVDDVADQLVATPLTNPVIANNDLLSIKQQALLQLSPLIGHLDQSPEEKFRTTMMMIQAADDQTLITQAYEAAQSITDEKTRAQALLDVVNEINYFTQHQDA